MNANVSESNIIVDEAIVQPNIKEKVEVRKVLYKVVKRLIDILGGLVGCVPVSYTHLTLPTKLEV